MDCPFLQMFVCLHFSQASIPSLGQVKPFMSENISIVGWDKSAPYISMTEHFVLCPGNKTSTALWDMDTGNRLGMLEGHTSMVRAGEINIPGSMAMTVADKEQAETFLVKLWNLETMQCTANLTATWTTSSLLKDRLLLEDGFDIKVWDLGGSTPVALMDLVGHGGVTWSIASSETANVALSGSSDESMRLWDLRTGRCVRVMEGHVDEVLSVSMEAACQTAVSGSEDETVKLWDLGSGQCIRTHKLDHHVFSVQMHESGGSFLVASRPMFLRSFTTASGYDQKPFIDINLTTLCGAYDLDPIWYPCIAALKDLSKVGICYLNAEENGLGVSVWN